MKERPWNIHKTNAATSSVTVQLQPMYGNSRYIVLPQAIEILMFFDYLGSVRFRHEAQHLRHWLTQIAHGMYGLQPRKVLQWSSRGIARELGVSIQESPVYLLTINWIHTIIRGKHICLQILVL